jgi:hypothetical protein
MSADIPVPLIQEAIGVALKVIELCEVRKTAQKRLRVDIILLSENICHRAEGQRAAR